MNRPPHITLAGYLVNYILYDLCDGHLTLTVPHMVQRASRACKHRIVNKDELVFLNLDNKDILLNKHKEFMLFLWHYTNKTYGFIGGWATKWVRQWTKAWWQDVDRTLSYSIQKVLLYKGDIIHV